MPARMEFNFSFARPQAQSTQSSEADTPLRILVLGNFSGGGSAPVAHARLPLGKRPLMRIDIDRFDEVMRRLSPRVRLGGEGISSATEDLEFHELDDFRPESFSKKLKAFHQLHELRKKLLSPNTFAEAAAELKQSLLAHEPVAKQPADVAPAPASVPTEDDASTLERILGQTPSGSSGVARERTADQTPQYLQRIIDQAVAPYIVPKADPHQDVYLAAVDKAMGDQVRDALHDPSFQSLEATWRSLHKLISNIEDDSEIQIHLLDVTYEELLADVPINDEQLRQWSLYRRLTEASGQALGASPWSLIVGDFLITALPQDLTLLGALAVTAESLQAPLITSAHSNFLGCSSLVDCPNPSDWKPLDAETLQYWQTLRRSSAAAWVGLVLPRVLLRLPYGKATNVVDSFEFEEFVMERKHEDYLWGNPAYLCAELIAQSFAAEGWSMELESQIDIGDLPAHTYREEDEVKLQPCGEVAFGERTAEAILQRGLMPLLSWKNRDAVRFLRFQSIADPIAPLAGPWS